MGPAEEQGTWRKTPTSRGMMSVASSHRASKQMGAHGHSTAGRRDVKLVRGLAALALCAAAAVGGGGGGREGARMFMLSNHAGPRRRHDPGERAYQRAALLTWLDNAIRWGRFATAMTGEIASGTCCILSLATLSRPQPSWPWWWWLWW
jgi:hypothetical protein